MAKSKNAIKQRTPLEKTLIVVLVAVILFLLLASHYSWWPFSSQNDSKLGTAFGAIAPASNTGTGSSGSNGSTGLNGTNGTNGTTATTTTSSLLTFAAGVNVGDTKADVSGQANGLNEHCSVVVNATSVGKQEVCTYTEGDKIVTVTYLDDHVVSASRSGF